MNLPTIERLTSVIVETVVEAIQKKPWTAYINNTFDMAGLAFDNKKLAKEFVQINSNPNLLKQIESSVLNHPKLKPLSADKSIEIFRVVWTTIVFNASSILKIKSILQES